jgi:organic hydroperoxide reductase OsmC/OhrA
MQINPDGSGQFTQVTLHPSVRVADGNETKIAELHDKAHRLCCIARSMNFPIEIHATSP